MQIALYSDLHLEHGEFTPDEEALSADLVILAGDIALGEAGMRWAEETFPDQTIVYVAGNHEFYHVSLDLVDKLKARYWVERDIHFLEKEVLHLKGVRILGTTLWSGFNLYGEGWEKAEAMRDAERYIRDYAVIRKTEGGSLLTPADTLAMHQQSVEWLEQSLATPFDGKTIVVTHFPPHPTCADPQFEGSKLSPYFVNDLRSLMSKYPIELWCHGHTHFSTDFTAEYGCRVISNQRGYLGEVQKITGNAPVLHLLSTR